MKQFTLGFLLAFLFFVQQYSFNNIIIEGKKILREEPNKGSDVDAEGKPWKKKISKGSLAAAQIPKIDLVELQTRTGLNFFGLGNMTDPIALTNPNILPPKEEDEQDAPEPKQHQRNLRTENEDESKERKLNIFLPDNRIEVDETQYPYRAVGKFGGCTAQLIYSNIIITNAHCLDYNSDGTMNPSTWSKIFYAGYNNGAYVQSSGIKRIIYWTYYDHAVIQLWTPLNVGWFGQTFASQSYFSSPRLMNMISYSGDHCTAWNNCRAKMGACYTRGTSGSYDVKHSCDATRGSSGSALFAGALNAPYMQLLNWGENRNGGENSLILGETGYVTNPNYAKPGATWYSSWVTIKNYGFN